MSKKNLFEEQLTIIVVDGISIIIGVRFVRSTIFQV